MEEFDEEEAEVVGVVVGGGEVFGVELGGGGGRGGEEFGEDVDGDDPELPFLVFI